MVDVLQGRRDQLNNDRNLYRARLIELVRANPVLWDKKSSDFNQRSLKVNKWMEVSNILGVSKDKLRRTWENLRDQYRRDLKRTMTMGVCSKWRFFNDMNFIRPMVRIKGSAYVGTNSESESDYDECTSDISAMCVASMLHSGNTTANTTTPTTEVITTTSLHFQPIQLSTEWKHNAITQEQQQQQQQQKPAVLEVATLQHWQQQFQAQQQQSEEQPQQYCDSSEEQKVYENYLDNDDDDISKIPEVIKIELDSDSDHASSQHAFVQQQQPQTDPLREPRAVAPPIPIKKPEIDSDEYVTTSGNIDAKRRRRQTTKVFNAADDDDHSCRDQCQHELQDLSAEKQDEDYHFVMSILPALRQVARQRKFPLRSQIMGLISNELEASED